MGGQINGLNGGGGRGDEEQDGMSVHSPCKAPLSSASSLRKVRLCEQSQVELELRLLEALEIYPPVKLRGKHTSSLRPLWPYRVSKEKVSFAFSILSSFYHYFNRHFSPSDVLQLMDRFYNLEMLKPDDEETEILNQEEDFCLPESYFIKEES
ncbi:hypothetical protein RJ640_007984 [Escallonia rubra]|uniref:Uncharacterized protein n=1 Tax=Escallonia rubra TaxID=112253 RepID=A0AA88QCT3_9ASTE|nr:hypothetical protein RJ640_007984 [Escallonia rubra]